MSDLIDRDRVCKTLMDDCHIKIMSGNNWIRLEEAVARLAGLPTIEERKKGKWIKISPANIYECSECGQNVMTRDIDVYKYCHGCGADMRGDDRENDRR